MKAKASSPKKHLAEVIALGLAFLGILGACLSLALRPKSEATYAEIVHKGELIRRLSLKEEKDLRIKGEHGELVISVKDGGIAVLSSPCHSHYCVNQGYKRAVGECIICVPESLAIYLRGEGEISEVTL